MRIVEPPGGGEGPRHDVLALSAGAVALAVLACLPAWAARSALATIPGDEDSGALYHVQGAVVAFAFAVVLMQVALRVWSSQRPAPLSLHAASLLLPAAWLPSASTLPLAVEVVATAAVALAGLACAAAHLRATPSRRS